MEQRASVSVALVLALTLCFLQCGFSNEHCTTCEQNRECAKQDSSECDYADSWEPEARESTTLWDAYKGIYQDTLSYHKFMMTIALDSYCYHHNNSVFSYEGERNRSKRKGNHVTELPSSHADPA